MAKRGQTGDIMRLLSICFVLLLLTSGCAASTTTTVTLDFPTLSLKPSIKDLDTKKVEEAATDGDVLQTRKILVKATVSRSSIDLFNPEPRVDQISTTQLEDGSTTGPSSDETGPNVYVEFSISAIGGLAEDTHTVHGVLDRGSSKAYQAVLEVPSGGEYSVSVSTGGEDTGDETGSDSSMITVQEYTSQAILNYDYSLNLKVTGRNSGDVAYDKTEDASIRRGTEKQHSFQWTLGDEDKSYDITSTLTNSDDVVIDDESEIFKVG